MEWNEPIYTRRLATFSHSTWDLHVVVEKEQRRSTYKVTLLLGSGGSVLKERLSKHAALAFAATVTMTPEA